MKILVDEMPYFNGDCFFHDRDNCKINGCHCARFDVPCKNRNPNECECLITLEAKITDTEHDRKE